MTEKAAPTLALEDISKRFGPTQALTGASLRVRPRTIHALLGENGAGKTTLMRIAYGLIQPDSGQIRLDGQIVRLAAPRDAIRLGIGMVHQHFTTVRAMTVAENIALGGVGRFDPRAAAARVRELAAQAGVDLDPRARAGELGVAAQQQLEILKALAHDTHILILDEPTAALPPPEAVRLLDRLRALAAHGVSIVLITHKLRDALTVADEVTVLRRGHVVLASPVSSIDEEMLARAMLGPAVSQQESTDAPGTRPISPAPGAPTPSRSLVLRARDIGVHDIHGRPRVRKATLDVHAGEIVGLGGVAGAGVHELLRALTGHLPIATGSLDRPAHVGFIPEDRQREALALSLTITENVALRGAGTRRGLMNWSAIREQARRLVRDFDVRAPGVELPASVLSGGNQQKLVLARELSGNPDLLIVENPTRGLDLRAASAIHARLRAARDGGAAIVLYSSDLDELLALSDRVFVMYAGLLGETRSDRDAIGQAMLGTGSSPDSTAPESTL